MGTSYRTVCHNCIGSDRILYVGREVVGEREWRDGGTDGLETTWGMDKAEGGGGGGDGVRVYGVLLCGCRVYALLQVLLFSGLNGDGLLEFIGVMGVWTLEKG